MSRIIPAEGLHDAPAPDFLSRVRVNLRQPPIDPQDRLQREKMVHQATLEEIRPFFQPLLNFAPYSMHRFTRQQVLEAFSHIADKPKFLFRLLNSLDHHWEPYKNRLLDVYERRDLLLRLFTRSGQNPIWVSKESLERQRDKETQLVTER